MQVEPAQQTSVERYIQQQALVEPAQQTSVERYIQQQALVEPVQQTSVERYIQQQAEIEADLDIVDLVIDSNTEETRLDVETEVLADIDASQVNDQIHFAEGIDGDIAEVFIEEADEVLQDLQMLIPQWLSQHDDDSLSVIRRHFHTLKGSGAWQGLLLLGS